MNEERKDELIKLTPHLVRLIVKTIKFSRNGLDDDERKELGQDLLELAYKILDGVV